MRYVTTTVAAAMLAVAGAQAGVLGIDLDPGNEATVDAPLFSESFGVSGSLGIDVEMDGEGKLSDARLCAADLLIMSGGAYAFGPAGLLTLSNIGITLQEKGGQEYFFNETAGSSQPGDYAGFLDTDGVAALAGTFAVDIDGDGTDEITFDLSDLDEEFRLFDFEGLITRDGGSNIYTLETFFALTIETSIGGQSLPISIEYSGGGFGVIPSPGTLAMIAFAGIAATRRRR